MFCILPIMCGQKNGPATAGPSATALLFYGLSPILGGYLHALFISIKSQIKHPSICHEQMSVGLGRTNKK